MNELNISTVGSDVTIDDLQLELVHPQTVNLCERGFSFSDMMSSIDLQTALTNGLVTAEDGFGNVIEDICLPNISSRLTLTEIATDLKLDSVVGGTSISVNNTDALNPVLNLIPLTWMQVNNTDTIVNINNSVSLNFLDIIPISGAVEPGSDTSDFTQTADGIQCNFTGVVLALSNVSMSSLGTDVSVQSRLRRNGSGFGSVGSSGFITNSNAHIEASSHCMGITQVLSGEEITVGARRGTSVITPVSLSSAGGSNLILIRLS